MEAFEAYLKQFPHFQSQLLEEVYPHLSIKHIEAGAYLLRQGRRARHIAFIEEGLMRLYYLNDGKEVTTCFCKEHTLTCSYQSLVTNMPSDISIQAIEPCKLVIFSYEALQKLYEKELFWQQVGRLVLENELINAACHNRFLSDLSATERYRQILNNDADLLQRVPLNYLASYLQIAPETLSRIRKKIIRT